MKFFRASSNGIVPALPAETQIPVLPLRHLALFNHEKIPRQQLLDVFEQGFGSGNIIEREIS